MALFAEDATWTADGGGKAAAAINVLSGNTVITKFLMGLIRKGQALRFMVSLPWVNGFPGMVLYLNGKPFAAYEFVIDGYKIRAVYGVANPDKLRNVQ